MPVFLLPNKCLFQVEIYVNTGFNYLFQNTFKNLFFKHVYVSSPLKPKMYKSEESPQESLWFRLIKFATKNERKIKKIRFNYVQRAD